MSDYVLGIDLGGTNFVVGLLDGEGKVVGHATEPTSVPEGPIKLMDRMAELSRRLAEKHAVKLERIKAVGIGTPGPISIKLGKIINAGNLPGFENFPLRKEISHRMNIPAVLENDANAACYGEFWMGAGREITDMVMFTLGTGIGGGIVCNGEVLHGSEDNGAELGHMIIQAGGRLCTCGQRGCLEAYASASNTANRAMEELRKGAESSLQKIFKEKQCVTSKEVFDHAQAGDRFALAIVDGTCQALALASVNMRHITEPQRVVLAGGMINAGDFLLERVRRAYEGMMWKLKRESMEICLAQLGTSAGYIGAAGVALFAWQHERLSPVGN